ncbi:MAG: VOC family protein [Panacagrimonas sp.]
MSHVVYRTYRYDDMIAWYQEVFGARIKSRGPALTFLTYDDEDHRFAFANLGVLKPGSAPQERNGLVGVDHVSYTMTSLADLLGNYEDLKVKGIVPYWCIHHGDTVSMYYADPDGNQMEFQVETFEAQRLVPPDNKPRPAHSPGVEFDPDQWLARLRAGTQDVELLVRTVHEPASPIRGAIARG